MTIFSAKLIQNTAEFGDFEIECSKGTYVRSFARDLCRKINVCGYVSELTRLQVGKFFYAKTISLAKLKTLANYGGRFLDSSMLCLHDVLDFMIEIRLDDLDAARFKNGQVITINFVSDSTPLDLSHASFKPSRNSVRVINNGELIGLGKFEENLLSPVNVFS